MGVTTNGYWIPFCDNKTIKKLGWGDISTNVNIIKTHWNVHFKWLDIMVGDLYLNQAIKVVVGWMNEWKGHQDVQVSPHLVKELYFWKWEPCCPRSFHLHLFKDVFLEQNTVDHFSFLFIPSESVGWCLLQLVSFHFQSHNWPPVLSGCSE